MDDIRIKDSTLCTHTGHESDSDSHIHHGYESDDSDTPKKPINHYNKNHDTTRDEEHNSSHDNNDDTRLEYVDEQQAENYRPANTDVRGSSNYGSRENSSERPGTKHQTQPPKPPSVKQARKKAKETDRSKQKEKRSDPLPALEL